MYTQNFMRLKLVIAILVLALSGANSGAAAICAANCIVIGKQAGYRQEPIDDSGNRFCRSSWSPNWHASRLDFELN